MSELLIDTINLSWKERLKRNVVEYGRKLADFSGTVHLFTPTLFFKDAVSRNILEEASVLSLITPRVRLYAENAIGNLGRFTHSWDDLQKSMDPVKDRLIYHYSIGTPTLKQIAAHPIRKHAIYFGITPPSMIGDPEVAALCQKGIDELPLLARFQTWVANSNFTMNEIGSAGGDHEKFILPPFLSIDKWDDITPAPNELMSIHLKFPPETKMLLYVGRRARNKNIEELIHILRELRKRGDYRLVITGGGANPEYHRQLESLRVQFGLERFVFFFDEPSDEELKYLYKSANALLSASLHEGFCVPLVEAMKMRIPSFISNRGAMSETLGQSEGFLELGNYGASAEFIHGVLSNEELLAFYLARQHRRYLSSFTDQTVTEGYFNFFERVLK